MKEAQTSTRLVLPYGDSRIRCEVRRSKQRVKRSIAIHVEPDGRVVVDAPLQAADPDIRLAVARRLAWIHRRMVEVENRQLVVTPREYVSGETAVYLGRRYRLKVVSAQGGNQVRLRAGYLEVAVSNRSPETVRHELEQWFQARAKEFLPTRLAMMSERLRWVKAIPPLSIRRMSRQWGSCSPQGRISLNVGLVRVPRECIDYVLLHELTHLREHNHGPAFYRLLDRHLPNWKRTKARLDGLAEVALIR
ncbi:metal-dependent hydrolase [Lysobacter helvus]|uniref:Metal-dependent hydrolase n=2 Tax=Lysobacteraceae TaxID=32033 RepID=A0ABN6FR13_9GAMM|nr:metal-dependent hydrolase [Lysobacter caseinilyticus]BCT95201.1 metal-dependent hydrolase [Lysobacter helvus]